MAYQDPAAATTKVGPQVIEAFSVLGQPCGERARRACRLLTRSGCSGAIRTSCSGEQRVVISAMALAQGDDTSGA